jgi:hypothetical protein
VEWRKRELAGAPVSTYLEVVEVHFTAETEKKLRELAAQGGHQSADELVQNVVESYFQELRQTGEALDRRYDDLKSGRVQTIPSEKVEAHFRAKAAVADRARPPKS